MASCTTKPIREWPVLQTSKLAPSHSSHIPIFPKYVRTSSRQNTNLPNYSSGTSIVQLTRAIPLHIIPVCARGAARLRCYSLKVALSVRCLSHPLVRCCDSYIAVIYVHVCVYTVCCSVAIVFEWLAGSGLVCFILPHSSLPRQLQKLMGLPSFVQDKPRVLNFFFIQASFFFLAFVPFCCGVCHSC